MSWRDGDDMGIDQDLAAEVGVLEDMAAVSSPPAAFEVMHPMMMEWPDREVCVVLSLNVKHRLMQAEIVSVGSVDHTFMTPREVFRHALIAGAALLVVGHSHPSGDPEPSSEDRTVTRRLVAAGELIGIELCDHVIVAGPKWCSMARKGLV